VKKDVLAFSGCQELSYSEAQATSGGGLISTTITALQAAINIVEYVGGSRIAILALNGVKMGFEAFAKE